MKALLAAILVSLLCVACASTHRAMTSSRIDGLQMTPSARDMLAAFANNAGSARYLTSDAICTLLVRDLGLKPPRLTIHPPKRVMTQEYLLQLLGEPDDSVELQGYTLLAWQTDPPEGRASCPAEDPRILRWLVVTVADGVVVDVNPASGDQAKEYVDLVRAAYASRADPWR